MSDFDIGVSRVDKRMSKKLSVRIKKGDFEKLSQFSNDRGESPSNIVRRLILDYIKYEIKTRIQ